MTDQHTIIKAELFMHKFWTSWCAHAAEGQTINYAVALVTPDTGKALKNDKTGYREYREVVLTMLDRAGGCNDIVDEVMGAFRATPAEKWRDERSTNRSKPTRKKLLEHDVPVPTAGQALDSRVHASLARRLFGDSAVDMGGSIVEEWKATVDCFLFRRYENLRRSLDRKRKSSGKEMAALDDCLKAAHASPTAPNLRAATKALVTWRKTALVTLELDDPPFLERDKEVAALWAEVGFEFGEKVKKKGRSVNAKNTSSIPTDDEMEAAFQYYVEDYCNGLESLDELPVPALQAPHDFQLIDDETDIGVHEFKGLPVEEVWQSLGLAGAHQFPFAEPGTTYPTEQRRLARPAAVPLEHQVVGARVMIGSAFTQEIGQRASPIMLCDDVGLGKTIQIISLVSYIKHLYAQQELKPGNKLPPPEFTITNNTPYPFGLEIIPNLPSIIITPRTLGGQWMEEFLKFTQPGSFSIVRYSVDQGPLETFSSNPKGPYRIAAGPNGVRASSVIIIADLSAIAKEAKRCLEPPPDFYRGNAARLWEARGEVASFRDGVSPGGSLLSMRFRVAAVDEIHLIRNCNVTQRGVQLITENSHLVVGATATPLYTSVPSVALCTFARGPWCRVSQEDGKVKEATGQYKSTNQTSALKTSYVSQGAIQLMRELLRPILIRRTRNSKDHQGKAILALPELKTIIAWSPMKKKESIAMAEVNAMHERWKELLEKKAKAEGYWDPIVIKWRNFLLDQKHASMHDAILAVRELEREQGLKEGELFYTIIADWNASNIDEKASSRMLKVDEILEWFWAGNPKALVFHEDGSKNLDAVVKDPVPCDQPRKFLIYVSLVYHRNLFGKMFEIKKRGFTYYDGSMTLKKRQEADDKFTTDKDCRIMIISNVGSAGLNLTVASVVILVSPVWSGSENHQILGRCHRHSQERDVLAYQIIAPEGVDLALMGIASGKTLTSDQFMMSQNQLQKIYHGVTGQPEIDDTDDTELESTIVKTKNTALTTRKRKGPPVNKVGEVSQHDMEARQGSESRPTKRRKTTKPSSGDAATSTVPGKSASPPAVSASSSSSGGKVITGAPATLPVSESQQATSTIPAVGQRPKAVQLPSAKRSGTSHVVGASGETGSKVADHENPIASTEHSQPTSTIELVPRPKAATAKKAGKAATREQRDRGSGARVGISIMEEDVNPSSRPTAAMDLPLPVHHGVESSLGATELPLPHHSEGTQKRAGFCRPPKKGAPSVQRPSKKQEPKPPHHPSSQPLTAHVALAEQPRAEQNRKDTALSSSLGNSTDAPTMVPPVVPSHPKQPRAEQNRKDTALSSSLGNSTDAPTMVPPVVPSRPKIIPGPKVAMSSVESHQGSAAVAMGKQVPKAVPPPFAKRARVGSSTAPNGEGQKHPVVSAKRDPPAASTGRPQPTPTGLPVPRPLASQAASQERHSSGSGAPRTECWTEPERQLHAKAPASDNGPSTHIESLGHLKGQTTQKRAGFRAPAVMGASSVSKSTREPAPDRVRLPSASGSQAKVVRLPSTVASKNGQILSKDGQ
ncbi:hypothetical protein RSAG8_10625, partial [Rhizoctonia solani AG-8 WAC10335]